MGRSLGWEDPLEKGMATHSSNSCLENRHGQRNLVGLQSRGHTESDMTAVSTHILEQMEAFGITGGAEAARKYPHQLSGGMRQRIAIAMALESEAKLLIADEPTTSLDTINQRRAVEFIDNLRRERGLSMLYITHNLGIIQAVCENVIIMKDGGIVEQGRTQDVFSHPKHAYVRRLLDETRRIQR